jgi:hydrogenase 3 maturation protease
VGIGNELRGDDAAGLIAIQRLQEALERPSGIDRPRAEVLCFEAGPLPENASGPLRRFGPDLVILLDAAVMDGAPGEVRWIDPNRTSAVSAGTHGFPLASFSEYLTAEFGCRVGILGFQPKNLDFDTPVSEEIGKAIQETIEFLAKSLS